MSKFHRNESMSSHSHVYSSGNHSFQHSQSQSPVMCFLLCIGSFSFVLWFYLSAKYATQFSLTW